MVGGKWKQESIHKDHMLEVVDQALSVEKVVGAEQEIPINPQENAFRC